MSITGELRAFAYELGGGRDELLDIADRIDADHESMLADARKTVYQGYVELPKDVDGITINIGDVIDCGGSTFKVNELRLTKAGWNVGDCRHHKPTVEDVIDELLLKWPDCETPAQEHKLKANIVAKLRLADDGEEQ